MTSQNLSDVRGTHDRGPHDHVDMTTLQPAPHAQKDEGDGNEGVVVQTGRCGGPSSQEGQVKHQ